MKVWLLFSPIVFIFSSLSSLNCILVGSIIVGFVVIATGVLPRACNSLWWSWMWKGNNTGVQLLIYHWEIRYRPPCPSSLFLRIYCLDTQRRASYLILKVICESMCSIAVLFITGLLVSSIFHVSHKRKQWNIIDVSLCWKIQEN